MERGGPQRRRIDRVSADDFLEGLADRSAEEVRSMRDECRAEESQVSYHRRLLQGRIDVARAEQDRRRGGEQTSLVDALPSILAGSDSSSRTGQLQSRYSPVDPPPETPARRAEDVAANDSALSRLPDLDDQELDEVVDELTERERTLSDLRRRILDNLDTLQDELVRRYRTGGAVAPEDVGLDRNPDEETREQPE